MSAKRPQPKTDKIRHPKQDAFIAAFAGTGRISEAARIAGIHRDTHYEWLRSDPKYVERLAKAKSQVVDLAKDELWRRAVDGYEEPVFYKGEQVSTIRRYSDGLLIRVLQSLAPEEFRERHEVEHNGQVGVKIEGLDDLVRTVDQT